MADAGKIIAPYHLADGIILTIGPLDTWLVDLEKHNEVRIDYRFVEPLEKLCLGWQTPGYESYVPNLLEQKLLEPGPQGTDGVIKRRLEQLDGLYMRAWATQPSGRVRAAYEGLVSCHSQRKRFFTRVGQCPVLPETALRRALLVGDAAEVGKKRVLCVGDDDLVSVALALLGHDVVVFDIDEFLLTFLRARSEAMGLSIRVVERDLRDPIDDITDRFDVFLTDPMSNRDCFEIFLSRAFALLEPNGVGYTAVYGPVSRLFSQVAGEMGFAIDEWWLRHNHYYSKYMKMHDYESDWVRIRPTPALKLKHGASDFSVPLNLYREDYYQRFRNLVSLIDDIEATRYARPLFLDMLLDGVERLSPFKFPIREMYSTADWTVIFCPLDDGYLTVHVDRKRRQFLIDMHPFEPEVEEPLRELIVNAHKTSLKTSAVSIGRSPWDVRLR